MCCSVVCKTNLWSQWQIIEFCLVCLCGVRTQCRIDFRRKNNASFCQIIKNINEINVKVLLSSCCSQFQIFAASECRHIDTLLCLAFGILFVLTLYLEVILNAIVQIIYICLRRMTQALLQMCVASERSIRNS